MRSHRRTSSFSAPSGSAPSGSRRAGGVPGTSLPSSGRVARGHPSTIDALALEGRPLPATIVPLTPLQDLLQRPAAAAANHVIIAGAPLGGDQNPQRLPGSGLLHAPTTATPSNTELTINPDGSYEVFVDGQPGSIASYFLPWANGTAAHIPLPGHGQEGDAVFFTPLLDGCMVVIGGDPRNPTVYHFNAATSTDTALEGLSDAERQAIGIARMLAAYNELSGGAPGTFFSPPSYLREPSIDESGSQVNSIRFVGSVFGVRRDGQWTFYWQSGKHISQLDTSQGTNQQFFAVVDSGELWPAPSHPRFYTPFNFGSSQAIRDMASEIRGIERSLHLLPGRDYNVLGPASDAYNCIAHSVGDHHHVFDFNFEPTQEAALREADKFYGSRGFFRLAGVDPGNPLPGNPGNTEMVVVYGDQRPYLGQNKYLILHAARREPDGTWTSKLGRGVLIQHATPATIAGTVNGQPVAVYVRPSAPKSDADDP